jgi:regulator of cell morphogenesis and NO signaling
MTELTPNLTLAEIVTTHPSLARQLEAYDLDYCCGGATTLQDACASNGIDVAIVLDELADAATDEPADTWSTMGLVDLVDHLETTHHAYLWSELPRLSALMDKVVSVHGERHPELGDIGDCYATIRADLEPHLLKEEHVLFPMVRELATADSPRSFRSGSIQIPISVLLTEHDSVGDLLRQLRSLTHSYTPPADGCGSYLALFAGFETMETDTHLHIHKENNVLFPALVDAERRLVTI